MKPLNNAILETDYVTHDQRMDDLEDVAYLKRRVSELEDNQETIVKFLTKNFPKKANQLN